MEEKWFLNVVVEKLRGKSLLRGNCVYFYMNEENSLEREVKEKPLMEFGKGFIDDFFPFSRGLYNISAVNKACNEPETNIEIIHPLRTIGRTFGGMVDGIILMTQLGVYGYLINKGYSENIDVFKCAWMLPLATNVVNKVLSYWLPEETKKVENSFKEIIKK